MIMPIFLSKISPFTTKAKERQDNYMFTPAINGGFESVGP